MVLPVAATRTTETYRFDGWELDLKRGRLSRRGLEVALRPKAFEVLAHLVRRAGQLVPREELLATVWPAVHVSRTTLATTVHEVRSVLASQGGGRPRLRTAHGRGYSLEASLEIRPSDEACHGRLVGRWHLLDGLEAVLDRGARGFGHSAFLVGETGIGKSRVLEETARRADERGFAVHVARCLAEASDRSGWPWSQLLRGLLRDLSEERRLALETRHAAALQLLSEGASNRTRMRRARDSSAPAFDRFTSFDSLAALLDERARERPRLLLVDDLEAADSTTLDLLRHIALTLVGAPVVVLGAARPRETAPDPLVEDLRGMGHAIALGGLDPNEVAALTASVTGRAPSIDLARELHLWTGGNPFLVLEMARGLRARDMHDPCGSVERALPSALRTLECARMARIGPAGLRLLKRAASLGASFDARDLECAAVDPGSPKPAALLAAALRQGILVQQSRAPKRLRFARSLSRDVLLRNLT